MKRFLLNVLRALLTLLGVWLFVQLIPRWLPEDPARIAAGEWATETEVQALRSLMRLDLPWWMALKRTGTELLRGDLGQSLRYKLPVAMLILESFPVSLQLALLALMGSAGLGWLLGLWKGPWATFVRALAMASPAYVLGPLLLWGIAQHVPGLPVAGLSSPAGWILPSLTLSVPLAGHQGRILSTQLGGLMDSIGHRWATGMGLPAFLRWKSYLVPAVAGPWLTILGLQLGGLLGGAVLVETIFGLPGLGRLLVQALASRDLPLVQGTVFLGALLYVLTQLTVEGLQTLLDPRLR